MKSARLALFAAIASASAVLADDDGVKRNTDEYVFLSDGNGHFVAGAMIMGSGAQLGEAELYYARGSEPFYAQYVTSNSRNDAKGASWMFWSPQAATVAVADRRSGFEFHGDLKWDKPKGAWMLRCGVRYTPLFEVKGPERAALAKRKFLPRLHTREVFYLARDDAGNYVLIDKRADRLGGGNYRFYQGRAGAMSKLKLLDVIRDEIGEIFRTPAGRMVRNLRKGTLLWYPKGRDKEPVEYFELASSLNDYLVYGSLGIYTGRLGTPCDDL